VTAPTLIREKQNPVKVSPVSKRLLHCSIRAMDDLTVGRDIPPCSPGNSFEPDACRPICEMYAAIDGSRRGMCSATRPETILRSDGLREEIGRCMCVFGESVAMMSSKPARGATIRDLENEGQMSSHLFDSTNCLPPNPPCMLLLDFHIHTPARNSTFTRPCKPHQGRVAVGASDGTLLR